MGEQATPSNYRLYAIPLSLHAKKMYDGSPLTLSAAHITICGTPTSTQLWLKENSCPLTISTIIILSCELIETLQYCYAIGFGRKAPRHSFIISTFGEKLIETHTVACTGRACEKCHGRAFWRYVAQCGNRVCFVHLCEKESDSVSGAINAG